MLDWGVERGPNGCSSAPVSSTGSIMELQSEPIPELGSHSLAMVQIALVTATAACGVNPGLIGAAELVLCNVMLVNLVS